jgi:protein required for attachment to host cells/ribosome-associated translation inhibitor RaiA
MDGSMARFFVLRRSEEGQVFEELASPLAARRKQPRDKAEKVDIDTLHFTRDVAAALDAALADKKFDRLVVVAPPRILSELRDHMTARVRETLAHQVPKNLAGLGVDALWEKLSLILLTAARPVSVASDRVPTVSGNSLPVSVVFRNMDTSLSVQSAALKYAAKLGRKFGRIQNCRVTVEAPKHEHRKVKEFRVAIDMKVPGHEIAAKAASSDGPAFDDLGTALREAFASATRQLQDHVHRVKGEVLRERRHAAPRNAA